MRNVGKFMGKLRGYRAILGGSPGIVQRLSLIRKTVRSGLSNRQSIGEQVSTNSDKLELSLDYKSITEDVIDLSVSLSKDLFAAASKIVAESQDEQIAAIKFFEPGMVSEPNQFLSAISPALTGLPERTYYRWRASAKTKTLSLRAAPHCVEMFIVPNRAVPWLSISEFGSRLAAAFVLRLTAKGYVWLHNNKTFDSKQAAVLLAQCLSDIASDVSEPVAQKEDTPLSKIHVKHNKQVDALLMANQHLLFKLVHERETTKAEMARELHDSVLADLMMLRRYLSGDRELSKKEVSEVIDEITDHLRDIVNDYTPKTLQEWGLGLGLAALLEKLHERVNIQGKFHFPNKLPSMPELVELNVYRIFQECINNIAKYAQATEVTFSCQVSSEKISFILTDNGKGFNYQEALEVTSFGFGLRSMQERVDLIRCFYPAKFTIDSRKGAGTSAVLEIEFSCPSGMS